MPSPIDSFPIVDLLGKYPKIGDLIVYTNVHGVLTFSKIKAIKKEFDGVSLENFEFVLSTNFLIVNCLLEDSPELFI